MLCARGGFGGTRERRGGALGQTEPQIIGAGLHWNNHCPNPQWFGFARNCIGCDVHDKMSYLSLSWVTTFNITDDKGASFPRIPVSRFQLPESPNDYCFGLIPNIYVFFFPHRIRYKLHRMLGPVQIPSQNIMFPNVAL